MQPTPRASTPTVAIVGGGHNALTAAAYLARAGVQVTLLERLAHVGGAAISTRPFAGVEARLSRYSYLVSLLPQRILDDLGVRVPLARRRYASYTPTGEGTGLLVDGDDAEATRASFASIGAADDAERLAAWQERVRLLAGAVFPTMTEPLPLAATVREAAGPASAWHEIVAQPIGESIRAAVHDDLVRGMVATDALIGTFAPLGDDLVASEQANRCMLYHVIGGGTGDWDVPIGGMGQVSSGLERAARAAGATLVTGAEVLAVAPDGDVRWRVDDDERSASFDLVLSAVAPYVLDGLVDAGTGDVRADATPRPEGAQVKVNMVLSRLPRLRGDVSPEAAFGGTLHVQERLSQLDAAYVAASDGRVPDPLPCEIYCHTLADRSILGPSLAASTAQTLTVFGLHAPDRLVDGLEPGVARQRMQEAVLASLDSVLDEPLEPLLLPDSHGEPCIETRTTRDLEASLGMPGGHIFHGPLSWPWLDERPASTAEAWGVATAHDRILHAGAGAVRGGAVSGIGGHDAAHAALAMLRP